MSAKGDTVLIEGNCRDELTSLFEPFGAELVSIHRFEHLLDAVTLRTKLRRLNQTGPIYNHNSRWFEATIVHCGSITQFSDSYCSGYFYKEELVALSRKLRRRVLAVSVHHDFNYLGFALYNQSLQRDFHTFFDEESRKQLVEIDLGEALPQEANFDLEHFDALEAANAVMSIFTGKFEVDTTERREYFLIELDVTKIYNRGITSADVSKARKPWWKFW